MAGGCAPTASRSELQLVHIEDVHRAVSIVASSVLVQCDLRHESQLGGLGGPKREVRSCPVVVVVAVEKPPRTATLPTRPAGGR